MKLYLKLIVLWVILISVGIYLAYYADLSVDFPLHIIGQIIIIIGVVVLIIWLVYFIKQFIPRSIE